MKINILIFLFTILSLLGCSNNKNKTTEPIKTIVPQFQQICDSAGVNGSILIYDLSKNIYYSNNFDWAERGFLPASTFKIANSIIALETGVAEDDSTLFKWDGKKRSFKIWEQDLILHDAFHFSCVPCYQMIARNIGTDKMNMYLNKLNYGNMKVDSSNIDIFWLEGESKINQFQQIDFLKRFYFSELPISERTSSIMKRMMIVDDNDKYRISAKTGWSDWQGYNSGWYVGYVEIEKQVHFFATNITPTENFDMKKFGKTRIHLTNKAFSILEILK